jgi:hypothetical protein
MGYIDEIFERAHFQLIAEYILNGAEGTIHTDSYKERLDKPRHALFNKLRERYPDLESNEPLMNTVYDALGAYEKVYMEIGLQCGAKVVWELFSYNGKGKEE